METETTKPETLSIRLEGENTYTTYTGDAVAKFHELHTKFVPEEEREKFKEEFPGTIVKKETMVKAEQAGPELLELLQLWEEQTADVTVTDYSFLRAKTKHLLKKIVPKEPEQE